jgi:hypothetical protein
MELKKLKVNELKKIAKLLKIKGLTKIKKKDLIKKIEYELETKSKDELVGMGFFSDVKDFFNKGVQKVKKLFEFNKNYTRGVNNIIQKYGNKRILKIYIFRKPVMKVLEKVLDFISLGQFVRAKEYSNYDDLYHLGLVFQLEDNTHILMEKNAKIDAEIIKVSSMKDLGEIYPVNVNKQLIFGDALRNTETGMSKEYFTYSPFANNCQKWAQGVLKYNNLLTTDADKFIYQPLADILKMVPKSTPKIAKLITDAGGFFSNITGNLFGTGSKAIEKKLLELPPHLRLMKLNKLNKESQLEFIMKHPESFADAYILSANPEKKSAKIKSLLEKITKSKSAYNQFTNGVRLVAIVENKEDLEDIKETNNYKTIKAFVAKYKDKLDPANQKELKKAEAPQYEKEKKKRGRKKEPLRRGLRISFDDFKAYALSNKYPTANKTGLVLISKLAGINSPQKQKAEELRNIIHDIITNKLGGAHCPNIEFKSLMRAGARKRETYAEARIREARQAEEMKQKNEAAKSKAYERTAKQAKSAKLFRLIKEMKDKENIVKSRLMNFTPEKREELINVYNQDIEKVQNYDFYNVSNPNLKNQLMNQLYIMVENMNHNPQVYGELPKRIYEDINNPKNIKYVYENYGQPEPDFWGDIFPNIVSGLVSFIPVVGTFASTAMDIGLELLKNSQNQPKGKDLTEINYDVLGQDVEENLRQFDEQNQQAQQEDESINQQIQSFEQERQSLEQSLMGQGAPFSKTKSLVAKPSKAKYALHAVVIRDLPVEEANKIARHIIKNKNRKFSRTTSSGSIRYRNVPKTKFQKKSFRTKKMNNNVTLIFGKLQ